MKKMIFLNLSYMTDLLRFSVNTTLNGVSAYYRPSNANRNPKYTGLIIEAENKDKLWTKMRTEHKAIKHQIRRNIWNVRINTGEVTKDSSD